MKCPYCNQEIEDGSTVCTICGKELNSNSQVVEETEEAVEVKEAVMEEAVEVKEAVTEEAAEVKEAMTEEAAVVEDAITTDLEKKKKSKKTIIAGAIIAAAAVIGVGAAVMPRKSSKDMVVDAFKSIMAEGQTDPMEEIFGSSAMNEKLMKESSEVNMELQLQDSSDETIKQLATGKMGMTALNDIANKKMSFVLGVGFADMNIANLEFYLDDKQLAVAVPELSAKAFSFNYADDLEGQIERSPYLGQMFTENGIDVTGLNSYLTKVNEVASSQQELFNLKELWTRYKEGSKAIDDLKAAMTVEKTENKNFTISGKDQSCKGFNVTITKDALVQFATTSKEFFLSDEALKKDFIEYMATMIELQSTMSAMSSDLSDMTPEELQQETWKSAEEQVDSMIAQIKNSMGDLALVVYVTKDDKMASFDYSTTAKLSQASENSELPENSETADAASEDIKLYGTVAFAGGYSMMSNVKASLNVEDASAQVITVLLDKTGTYEAGKTYTGGLTASMSNGTDTYSMVGTADYAVEGGAYNMAADFQSNGTSIGKLSSTGLVQNLVKGESFEVYIDSIKMESDMITGTNEFIDISGFYKAGPLTSTIEIPAGETFDILAGTEEDFNTVISEIVGNAYGLAMSFY